MVFVYILTRLSVRSKSWLCRRSGKRLIEGHTNFSSKKLHNLVLNISIMTILVINKIFRNVSQIMCWIKLHRTKFNLLISDIQDVLRYSEFILFSSSSFFFAKLYPSISECRSLLILSICLYLSPLSSTVCLSGLLCRPLTFFEVSLCF